MACTCSESYNRIDTWEEVWYEVPYVQPKDLKNTPGCDCTKDDSSNPDEEWIWSCPEQYDDQGRRLPPIWPPTEPPCTKEKMGPNPFRRCGTEGKFSGFGGTGSQKPDGGRVTISGPTIVSTRYEPEPKCGGECDCESGKQEFVKGNSVKLETKNISIDFKMSNVYLICTCDGEDGKPIEWTKECKDYEITLEKQVDVMKSTAEWSTPVSCTCSQ